MATKNEAPKSVQKTVEMIFVSSSSLLLCWATYFTIPLLKPNTEIVSSEVIKFRKFPSKATPLGPKVLATTEVETNPVTIRISTLTLFIEVILKTGFWNMDFISFKMLNRLFVELFIRNYSKY